MFRVQDRPLSRKLIRLLTVFASTLTIALAGDRSVTTTWRADLSGGQDEIDISEHVVDAVRVMLDAARVHHHRGFRAAIESSRLDDFVCGHTANLRGKVW